MDNVEFVIDLTGYVYQVSKVKLGLYMLCYI